MELKAKTILRGGFLLEKGNVYKTKKFVNCMKALVNIQEDENLEGNGYIFQFYIGRDEIIKKINNISLNKPVLVEYFTRTIYNHKSDLYYTTNTLVDIRSCDKKDIIKLNEKI